MAGGEGSGAWVADLDWTDVEAAIARGAVAILPVGAGAKEHGRHLPLATDLIQAEWLASRLAAARQVLVWPTVNHGFYPSFVDYPGSVSISEGTFLEYVTDIVASIERAGATRLVLLNTGISTIRPLQAVSASPRLGITVDLLNVYSGERLAAACDRLLQQEFGGHADEMETSLMLALAPGRVQHARARPAPRQIQRGRFNRLDPASPNYSPDGVNGDPTLASAAKGEQLLSAIVADMLAAYDRSA